MTYVYNIEHASTIIKKTCISSVLITRLYCKLYYSKKICIYQIYPRATMKDTLKDIYAKSV